MPKLVCITAGFTDRVFDVKTEKGTLGRLEENSFCIPEPSVSSRHCELWAKGDEIVIKDLGSTNGSFINDAQLAAEKEATLRPGQTLRLGQVELRYETGKKQTDQARPAVKIGAEAAAAPSSKGAAFGKKTNNTNKIFLAVGAVLVIVILALLFVAFSGIGGGATGQ